jgi:hypothetical protein
MGPRRSGQGIIQLLSNATLGAFSVGVPEEFRALFVESSCHPGTPTVEHPGAPVNAYSEGPYSG